MEDILIFVWQQENLNFWDKSKTTSFFKANERRPHFVCKWKTKLKQPQFLRQMELNHSLLQRSVQAPAQLSWTELVVVLLYPASTYPAG